MLKCLRDQVYGMVDIHPLAYKLILLPEFQRLRDIKQLNHLHYIYPGATHDRFQHCIGVYHLAEVFIERLQKIQPDLEITEQEKLCVCIAGLYHDIGHITQCHLYPLYTRRCQSTVFEDHEIMSVRIFLYVLEKYNLMADFSLYKLTDKDIHLICEIMMGDKKKSPKDWNWVGAPGREFLLQIVANAKSGVDVDRFDYMIRDCMNLGLHCSYNYDRIIKGAYVIKNKEGAWEICFHEKVHIDVCEMFQCRMSLHRRAYSHKSNRCIDLMFIDALCSAEQRGFGIKTKDGIVKLSEACGNLDAYLRATDYLLLQLKNSIEPEYEEARNLITRVECKQLYPLVGDVIINNERYSKSREMSFLMTKFNSDYVKRQIIQEFVSEAEKQNMESPTDYLIVDIVKTSMGMGSKNPLRSVSFYSESDPENIKKLHLSEVSNTEPQQCEDLRARIYCRGNEQQFEALNRLYQAWKERNIQENDSQENPTLKRRATYTFPSKKGRYFSTDTADDGHL